MDRGVTIGPRQLTDNLWRLGSHHMPSFLIQSEGEAALFEAGISASAALLPGQLARLSLPPHNLTRLIVSHSHADHSAGAQGIIAALPQAGLVMTQACHRHLAKPQTCARFGPDDEHSSREVCRRELGQNWPRGKMVSDLLPAPVQEMEPGQSLTVGAVVVELLAMDGHVPGGLMAWLPGQGAVLMSDSAGLTSRSRPFLPLYFVSYQHYQDTIARVKKLGPEVVCPGHQEQFSGPQALRFLDSLEAATTACHEGILADAKAGRRPREIAQRLFERYYCHEVTVYTPQNIMGCCELLVRRSLETG